MKSTRWDTRFWESTRGRIILLLRRSGRTVNDLAAALGLTDNAVRTHLDRLERDGLVQATGTRPGSRKPNTTYGLLPEAERLFPKMYGRVLRNLLEVLTERLPAKKCDEIIRTVGRAMAAEYRSAVKATNLEVRVGEVIAVLAEAGGGCDPGEDNGTYFVRCFDCPLGAAATGNAEVCRLMEAMLADLLDARVQQRCQADPSPHCYFEISDGREP